MITQAERRQVVRALNEIVASWRKGEFQITLDDQDVHMAVERVLTSRLGDLGKKVHTGRSRNDQVAVDLRLYAKEQLLGALSEAAGLADTLLAFGRKHMAEPMVPDAYAARDAQLRRAVGDVVRGKPAGRHGRADGRLRDE